MINLPAHDIYWKNPPRKEKGDARESKLFLVAGRALSKWETVEFVFSKLFGVFVGGNAVQANQTAEAAYGAIASHGGRIDVLEQAAAVFFMFNNSAKEERADCKTLLNHFQSAATIRNYIAHGNVVKYFVDGINRGWFLEPASYNSLKTSKTKTEILEGTKALALKAKYRYVSGDISEFTKKFTAFQLAAWDYYMALFVKFGPLASRPP